MSVLNQVDSKPGSHVLRRSPRHLGSSKESGQVSPKTEEQKESVEERSNIKEKQNDSA